MEVNKEYPWKILWTDEFHFHLTGYVNRQNCQIWIAENLLETQPVSLHSAKVTVWCEFTGSFIIWLYFFEEKDALRPVVVIIPGQRYKCLLNHVIQAPQQRGYVYRIIFMQDGATPHITPLQIFYDSFVICNRILLN